VTCFLHIANDGLQHVKEFVDDYPHKVPLASPPLSILSSGALQPRATVIVTTQMPHYLQVVGHLLPPPAPQPMLMMVREMHCVFFLPLLQADERLASLGLVLGLGHAVIVITAVRTRPPVFEVGPLVIGLPSPALFGAFHTRGTGE
jgi:hypothetical protein